MSWLGFLLIGTAGVMAYGLNVELQREIDDQRTIGGTGTASEIQLDGKSVAFTLPPLSDFQETISRPLFDVSRRPPQEKAAVQLPVVSPQTTQRVATVPVQLAAVVMLEDDRWVLLHDLRTGKTIQAREGSVLMEWTVTEIKRDAVVLRNADFVFEIPLRQYTPSTTPSPRQVTPNQAIEQPSESNTPTKAEDPA